MLELKHSIREQACTALKRMARKNGGRAESRTRVTRFRVWCDNHYTTQPTPVFHRVFLGYMFFLAPRPEHSAYVKPMLVPDFAPGNADCAMQ